MNKDYIFRKYDIRGVYREDFDKDFARELGQAYGFFSSCHGGQVLPQIVVGHDARLSSPEIMDALVEGLLSSGIKVYNLGLITTPMLYFSLFHMDSLSGGIMVTGSHNPPNYNGFKLSLGQETIFGSQIQELKSYLKASSKKPRGSMEFLNISDPYVERQKKEFQSLKDMGVVLDCGNGAVGVILRKLYASLGLNPHILFEEPDGRFPNHHPDPTVESNTQALKEAVVKTQAPMGIGFDGDGDRIAVVDRKGRFIPGDEIMMILARDVLKKNPGAKIIGDVKCSDRMYRDIAQHGGQGIMWKTGHSLIKNKIKLEKALFGGELSGHIFFADRNDGYDDAVYAGLRLTEILAQTNKNIDEMDLPWGFVTPEIRLKTTEEAKTKIIEYLRRHFSTNKKEVSVNLIDGLRISYAQSWALVRASNTEPAITLRFEAESEEKLISMESEMRNLIDPLL